MSSHNDNNDMVFYSVFLNEPYLHNLYITNFSTKSSLRRLHCQEAALTVYSLHSRIDVVTLIYIYKMKNI